MTSFYCLFFSVGEKKHMKKHIKTGDMIAIQHIKQHIKTH